LTTVFSATLNVACSWPAPYEDDIVVCLLRGGFSRVEQTLLEGGRGASVIQQGLHVEDGRVYEGSLAEGSRTSSRE